MVALEGMESVESVEGRSEGVVRCLPAYWRRKEDAGREVRRERRWRSVAIVVDEGIVRGTAVF